jgi:hypothetical protein
MPEFFQQLFQVPILTRYRIGCAYTIAVVADVTQFLLGPLGWAFGDELLDISAMILIWRLIGFHPLLLPTFVLEFLPVADMLPTWTGCVFSLSPFANANKPRPPCHCLLAASSTYRGKTLECHRSKSCTG